MRHLVIIFFTLTACLRVHAMIGENDPASAVALDRLNHQAALIRGLEYNKAVDYLRLQIGILAANPYATSRMRNELADLLTQRTLEIEAAVEVDQALLSGPIPEVDSSAPGLLYRPKVLAAVNRLLLDREHFNQYVALDSSTLRATAAERLQSNLLLLAGKVRPRNSTYTEAFLQEVGRKVRADIGVTYPGTADRKRFLSRLFKVDYESFRLSGRSNLAYNSIITGEIGIDEVDFGELNYLEFSEYLRLASVESRNSKLLEKSLQVLFKAYSNLRGYKNRWTHSLLINQRINDLIDSSFAAGQWSDLLYYISLNKSRILLEERLAAQGGGRLQSLGEAVDGSELRLDRYGMPERALFESRLKALGSYLDLYISGQYILRNEGPPKSEKYVSVDRTRDFGAEAAEAAETFVGDSGFVIYVKDGSVAHVRRLAVPDLELNRRLMERDYLQLSSRRGSSHPSSPPLLNDVRALFKKDVELTVSADKWLSLYPLEVYLDTPTVRAVNLLMSGGKDRPSNLEIVGFFNPTGDLPGAESEASGIRQHLSRAKFYVREDATLSAMRATGPAPLVHLSMHGAFNAQKPLLSKLYLAGARRGMDDDDKNALYVRDMGGMDILKGRDLVFAAACQTGLTGRDGINDSEVIGMLRPLMAGGNKNVILSLWKVDDEATGFFVERFYGALSKWGSIQKAFFSAQREVKEKYSNPFYWAAFYLVQSE